MHSVYLIRRKGRAMTELERQRAQAVEGVLTVLLVLAEYYATPEECHKWLTSIHPQTGEFPGHMIAQGRTDEVLRVIRSMDGQVAT